MCRYSIVYVGDMCMVMGNVCVYDLHVYGFE